MPPKQMTCYRKNAFGARGLVGLANTRVHATTGEVPLVRIELERERLQAMPTPWPGLTIQPARPKRPLPMPSGYQHSLRVYEELVMAGVR